MKQRDSWIGHVLLAAEECGTSRKFQTKIGKWLANLMTIYAPFYDEENNKLDRFE